MKVIKVRSSKDQTVLEALKENHISNKIIKSLKAQGNINKDLKPLHMADKVKEGDFISLVFEDKESDIRPVDIPLDIKYIDDNVMVVNKQYGLSVMSTMRIQEDTLLNAIQYYLYTNNIKSNVHIINRLDRYTTGLMMVALNRFSASSLSLDLKDTLKRKYHAIVKGKLDEKEGVIENKIAKESLITTRRCVRNDGKDAITKYKVIDEFGDYSLLEIELLTGRTHQIRVTFSTIGHPLLGDDMYDPEYNNEELMLESYYLEFIHPITKEKMILDIGITDRFKEVINKYK